MHNSISPNFSLQNQTALVTGASGGIGNGIAKTLAGASAHVIVHSRGQDRALKAAAQLNSDGFKATGIYADLNSVEEVDAMLATLGRQGLVPDLLVNNAGVQPVSALSNVNMQEWQDVFDTNLKAIGYLTRSLCNTLAEQKRSGAIVNIASIEGLDPALGHAHYAASKAGLIMFTKAAALEYGKHGIRINSVSPGLIDRKGLEEAWPEGLKSWTENAPLRRPGRPEDIGNAVLFLLSEAAGWITGTNLVVDGGMSVSPRW